MLEILPPYTLKRNPRSKRVSVSVSAGGRVIVSAPKRVPEFVIKSFLLSKLGWIQEKVRHFKQFPERKVSEESEKKVFVARKAEALRLAQSKLTEWNRHYKFSWNKISIRNSKSRWGSCSSKGTLSFNYKIVFLPEPFADYLVVHELCHLKERNHRESFWSLVAETVPDYLLRRKELRRFEYTLNVG